MVAKVFSALSTPSVSKALSRGPLLAVNFHSSASYAYWCHQPNSPLPVFAWTAQLFSYTYWLNTISAVERAGYKEFSIKTNKQSKIKQGQGDGSFRPRIRAGSLCQHNSPAQASWWTAFTVPAVHSAVLDAVGRESQQASHMSQAAGLPWRHLHIWCGSCLSSLACAPGAGENLPKATMQGHTLKRVGATHWGSRPSPTTHYYLCDLE